MLGAKDRIRQNHCPHKTYNLVGDLENKITNYNIRECHNERTGSVGAQRKPLISREVLPRATSKLRSKG